MTVTTVLMGMFNSVHSKPVSRLFFSFLFGGGLLVLSGCSTLTVESTPADATVIWSSDGLHYKPWPPNSWEWRDHSSSTQTPFSTKGIFGDSILVTVEKEGYLTPLPKLAELHSFRREQLAFEMTELPETVEARMRGKGFLYYQGQWVDPDEYGVVEYKGVVMKKDDAVRAENLAKGLVEYKGKWYEPKEALSLEEKDKLDAGYVLYKDRWVLAEEAEAEKRIDEEVASVAKDKVYQDLDAPKFVGRLSIEEVQIQLYNSSSQQIRFLFSGPTSKEYVLQPYRSLGVRGSERLLLEAGRYEIAVIPTGIDVTGRKVTETTEGLPQEYGIAVVTDNQWAAWPLPSGTLVSFNYTGMVNVDEQQADEFELNLPEPKVDIPEIDIPEVDLPKNKKKGRPSGPPPGGWGAGRR